MLAVECLNLTKKYKDLTAVNGINLQIEEGQLYGLLGVNGAGKTTLIKVLIGLTLPTTGSAKVFGYDVVKDSAEIKKIADISPQETSVAPNLTVEENLRFFAALYQTDEELIQKTLKDFGLEEVKKQRAKTLSGGYMRRLSIAAALVSRPKILFLDEPTLGLDVLARRELWRVINSLKGKITIVLTSHYLEEIEHLCDRVAVLKQGNLVAEGTVDELKNQTNAKTFEDAFVALIEADKSSICEGEV